MTDNIIKFPGKETHAPSPQVLIDFLVQHQDKVESLVVLGFTKEGGDIVGFACRDLADIIFHIRLTERNLLDAFEERE